MNRPFPVLLCTFMLAGAAFAAISDPIKLDSGPVSGIPGKDPSVQVYKGIPFAAKNQTR